MKPNISRVIIFAIALGIVVGIFDFVAETYFSFNTRLVEIVITTFAICYAVKKGYFYDKK